MSYRLKLWYRSFFVYSSASMSLISEYDSFLQLVARVVSVPHDEPTQKSSPTCSPDATDSVIRYRNQPTDLTSLSAGMVPPVYATVCLRAQLQLARLNARRRSS